MSRKVMAFDWTYHAIIFKASPVKCLYYQWSRLVTAPGLLSVPGATLRHEPPAPFLSCERALRFWSNCADCTFHANFFSSRHHVQVCGDFFIVGVQQWLLSFVITKRKLTAYTILRPAPRWTSETLDQRPRQYTCGATPLFSFPLRENMHATVQPLPAGKLKTSQLFSEAPGSNHISQPILYCMQWDSSPVTLATKEMEEKVAPACVRRSRALSDRNHNRDRKAHL